MNDRFERFYLIISEISKQQHKLIAELMSKYGLNGSHAMYLLSMYRHPAGISASQIGKCCSRDKSDVSRAMSVMVEKGFVKKAANAENHYRTLFKLTDKGNETAKYIQKDANCIVESSEADLTDEQRMIFYEALESVLSNLCQHSNQL